MKEKEKPLETKVKDRSINFNEKWGFALGFVAGTTFNWYYDKSAPDSSFDLVENAVGVGYLFGLTDYFHYKSFMNGVQVGVTSGVGYMASQLMFIN